jgi:thiamine biosynthesis lipoprotein
MTATTAKTALRVDFEAIGTTATVVATRAADLIAARHVLAGELERIDAAASRFRPDSEIARVHRASGRPVIVSGDLLEAIEVALNAAEVTGGLVDPTVGEALIENGYDRDFAAVLAGLRSRAPDPRPAPGWRSVVVDRSASTVRIPEGCVLDLGATAKALAVDRAAAGAAEVCSTGVLVSVGGDLAVAGAAPDEGWSVRVADSHDAGRDDGGPCVAVRDGGLATSSVAVRRWSQAGRVRHHIIDPATGRPAAEMWRTVSVAASSCVGANTASTAAVLMGEAAPGWLAALRLPARLVHSSGEVVTVGGWPDAEVAAA